MASVFIILSNYPISAEQFGGSGRVGGGPPKTLFLGLDAKMGSSVVVKSHHNKIPRSLGAFVLADAVSAI